MLDHEVAVHMEATMGDIYYSRYKCCDFTMRAQNSDYS